MARREREQKLSAPAGAAWFCVRSHPKHEHIAAAHLRANGLEVYLPRIRFRRATRRGIVWYTEALFPTYLFARFQLAAWLQRLNHLCGVHDVVHFGSQWPAVPDSVIASLRAAIQDDKAYSVRTNLQIGDTVIVAAGMFEGVQAVVTRVMPAHQRVSVLLEFLGKQTTLELASAMVRTEPGKSQWSF